MSWRAIEFLFLTYALGGIVVYAVHEQDVLEYKAEQRRAEFKAIRHAIRNVDPAKLYAPAEPLLRGFGKSIDTPGGKSLRVPPGSSAAIPLDPSSGYCTGPLGDDLTCTQGSYEEHIETLRKLDELERRLRDLYIRELQRRGEAWSA